MRGARWRRRWRRAVDARSRWPPAAGRAALISPAERSGARAVPPRGNGASRAGRRSRPTAPRGSKRGAGHAGPDTGKRPAGRGSRRSCWEPEANCRRRPAAQDQARLVLKAVADVKKLPLRRPIAATSKPVQAKSASKPAARRSRRPRSPTRRSSPSSRRRSRRRPCRRSAALADAGAARPGAAPAQVTFDRTPLLRIVSVEHAAAMRPSRRSCPVARRLRSAGGAGSTPAPRRGRHVEDLHPNDRLPGGERCGAHRRDEAGRDAPRSRGAAAARSTEPKPAEQAGAARAGARS